MDRSLYSTEEGTHESPRRTERQQSSRPSRPSRGRVRELLRSVLEADIIPRLMSAHRSPLTPPAAEHKGSEAAALRVGESNVEALVELSLYGEAHAAREYVRQLRNQGTSIEALYLNLLTPTARRIGVLWETDHCDFVLVTLALLRIQQVMYDLSPDFLQDGGTPTSRRILIAPVPGSHHTFGTAMVADFFRRDGWDVVSAHDLSRADITRQVRKEWFDVVALSIASPNQLILTTALVADIRKLSTNKGILVMLGGPLALSVPDLATRAGADVVTLDAREAVDVAGQAVPARGASVAN